MASWMQSSPALVAQPKPPSSGLLGRRLRLAQLVLSVAATAVLASASDIFRRYMIPVAALQCAWAAAAAVADVHRFCGESGRRRRRPRSSHWALRASLVLDGFTALATFASASGALGVAHVVVTTVCAQQEPVLCRDIVTGAAPKALLAWVALQIPATYFFLVQLYLLTSERAISS